MPLTGTATSSPSLSFFSSSIFTLLPSSRPQFLKYPSISTSINSQLSSPTTASTAAVTATLPVLSFSGDQTSTANLSLKSAPPSTARALVHRALITDQQNSRRGTASTLTRAEVSGGGKKPFQQKKTGRARRGSQRTPLRPGGGVIFGPKPRDWSIKMNRKEKRLSISTAIASAVAASGEEGDAVVVVEDEFGEGFEGPKTKEFVAVMKRWGLDPKEKAMFLMMEVPDNVRLSSRNVGTVKMLTPRTLNLFDILDSEKLVLTRSAVDYLNSMYGEYAEEEEEEEDIVQG